MSIALHTYLNPLLPFLNQEEVTEVCINKPQEVWIEQKGRFFKERVESLTENRLKTLAELLAEYNHKSLCETKPILSVTLPQGERCQIVLPPACERGQLIYSIRRVSVANLTLTDWEDRGGFAKVNHFIKARRIRLKDKLSQLIKEEKWQELLSFAIRAKLNIIISGGTSTAKTTLLNSCLKEIDSSERLITIEGVREVKTQLPNCVHLLANEDETSSQHVSMLDLLKVSFRLRPDRIFLSELRTKEAYPYLRACISGHPGSLTTLHADSIASAREQLTFMLGEAYELQGASEYRLKRLIKSAVDLIIQMRRCGSERFIEDIDVEGVMDELD